MLLIAVRGGFIPDDESAIPCLDHGFDRGMIRNDEDVFSFFCFYVYFTFVSTYVQRFFIRGVRLVVL